ncbi:MAG: NAD-dependent succinate-semialdehyde dehydrogenase [Bacteroidales bacterium]|nr:NAD-dependent succinate-semialdehyde dehydrogenase [Bacteroidales bacterium]
MSLLKSVYPYRPERVVTYRELSDATLRERIENGHMAFLKYRNSTISYRRERILKVAGLLKEHSRELAELITFEMGKPVREAVAEVRKCAWVCEYYAEDAAQFLRKKLIKSDAYDSYVLYQPLGTILAIMPWNYPFWQVFRFAAPALMAGNTALLKHAASVQGCGIRIEELFRDAGFEKDVFQNLTIGSGKVAQVIRHDAVRAVTLTGSERAGASVAALAGKYIKKCVLELGGNNAFVVLNDAHLDYAVRVALEARLQNGGQSCIAAKRFILQKGISDAFISSLMEQLREVVTGDPMDERTRLATLSSVAQAKEVERQVNRSVEMGAELLYGGKRKDAFFEPTVLSRVNPGMPVFDEEVFGPVFAVTIVSSPGDALELSNKSVYGLGIQVFTESEHHARLFIEGAEEGSVFVNGMVKSDPRLPFGGVKRSGFGRELSLEGIREFVNVKTVWVNR